MKCLLYLFFVPMICYAQTEFTDLPRIDYSRNFYYASEGFRLGFVLDFHRSGIVLWSYEGKMMTGFGTDKGTFVDQYCMGDAMNWINSIQDEAKKQKATADANDQCFVFNNPWPFSTLDSSLYKRYLSLKNLEATPVLLYFVDPVFAFSHAITETSEFVEGIYPINPDAPLNETSYHTPSWEMPIGANINVARGIVEGRIVTASLDHYLRKSFEVTIQEGPYGNNFRRMSVNHQALFDFIVKAMMTGKMLRVGYIELTGIEASILRIGKAYDTPYQIVSVEIEQGQLPTIPRPNGGK